MSSSQIHWKLDKMLQEIEFHKNKVHKYAADSPQIKITSSETWLAVWKIATVSLADYAVF